jgi:hypothetical protein
MDSYLVTEAGISHHIPLDGSAVFAIVDGRARIPVLARKRGLMPSPFSRQALPRNSPTVTSSHLLGRLKVKHQVCFGARQ